MHTIANQSLDDLLNLLGETPRQANGEPMPPRPAAFFNDPVNRPKAPNRELWADSIINPDNQEA